MSTRPITRKKTYELVAERLVGDISARRLTPGDVLPPERELTQSYGVGRSSVREALRMLESQGLIRAREGGTFAVAQFRNPLNSSLSLLLTLDAADLEELFEIRRILEGELSALAALRRSDDDLARMDAAVVAMDENLASEEGYIAADVSFHLAIAEATRNRWALHLMHAIRELLLRALGSIYHVPGSPERSLEQHRAILEAIGARRPHDARTRMAEHIARVEADIAKAVAGLPPALSPETAGSAWTGNGSQGRKED
ncbi:MAG: FadR/GntR family transcriptional regulator [Gaiellaceae bacterium]